MILRVLEKIWTALPVILILHFFIKCILGIKYGEGFTENLITGFVGLIGYSISRLIFSLHMNVDLNFVLLSNFVLKLFLPLCVILLMLGLDNKNRNYTSWGIAGLVFFLITVIMSL